MCSPPGRDSRIFGVHHHLPLPLFRVDTTRPPHPRNRDDHPLVQIVLLTMLQDDDSLFTETCSGAHYYILTTTSSRMPTRSTCFGLCDYET